MKDKEFWAIVNLINWNSKTDIYRVKRSLMTLYTVDEFTELYNIYSRHYDKLYTVISENCDCDDIPLGCDSGTDLLSHIIGLGQTVYEATLADPSLAVERYNKGQYTECFSYCLPHKSDVEYLDINYYKDNACKYKSEYDNIDYDEIGPKYHDAFKTLTELCTLLSEGKFDKVLDRASEIYPATDLTNSWVVYNIFSNYMRYYKGEHNFNLKKVV